MDIDCCAYRVQKFITLRLKGALDKYNIIPQHFPKKVGIFVP